MAGREAHPVPSSAVSEVRISASGEEWRGAAAARVAAIVTEVIRTRGRAFVALSGGSTPGPVYSALSVAHRHLAPWSGVNFFWSDERAVTPDDPGSNYRLAREALLDPLNIRPERVHRMGADREDLAGAARDYHEEMARTFEAPAGGPPPEFDLILLGLGEDGHIASLFPGAAWEGKSWAAAVDGPAPYPRRMTLTPPLLRRARSVIVLARGRGKAPALAGAIEGRIDPRACPAHLLRDGAGKVEWIVDAEAASRLRGTQTRA